MDLVRALIGLPPYAVHRWHMAYRKVISTFAFKLVEIIHHILIPATHAITKTHIVYMYMYSMSQKNGSNNVQYTTVWFRYFLPRSERKLCAMPFEKIER